MDERVDTFGSTVIYLNYDEFWRYMWFLHTTTYEVILPGSRELLFRGVPVRLGAASDLRQGW